MMHGMGWAELLRSSLITGAAVLLLLAGVRPASGQRGQSISASVVREVMPAADRFSDVAGTPPVMTGYRTGSDGAEVLYGYVFLTSDLPPEQFGYSGPIEALIGIRPDGTLTGIRVTDYNESYMSSMGDFLRTPGFQEQYAGKHIANAFRLGDDIDGISRVSISVRALSRGVRDASRRVAEAHGGSSGTFTSNEIIDPVGLTWFELRQRGFVERFEVTEQGEGSAQIALAHISSDRLGEYLFGAELYARGLQSVERRGGAENLVLYTVDGPRLRLFRRAGWSIVQDGDTTLIDPSGVFSVGIPDESLIYSEATMAGLMLVDGSVDMSRPFTFSYDLDELGTYTVEYVSQEARLAIAEAAEESAALEAASVANAARSTTAAGEVDPGASPAAGTDTDEAATETGPDGTTAAETSTDGTETAEDIASPVEANVGEAGDGPASRDSVVPDELDLQFVLTEDETLLERTLDGTSWPRVLLMLVVLALGSIAFFTKIPSMRWLALTVTLLALGFGDGGFLSVSHITSGISAGPGVYLRDVPLLLMVAFTVATTLIWGRVFCGFLCPFGALQDFVDRLVPDRVKRSFSQTIHNKAVYAKYIVLAIIVLPALAGSHVSLYQYFEPFGTVFFRSPSMFLWSIATLFLAASVVIPRFYCRYACPLGAALAVLSFISLRRIDRVEQCGHCAVCEVKCPTGAIRGATIDFHECVRCNICEVQLIQKVGVCRHDMDEIRPRLVQLKKISAGVGSGDGRV
jgi:Na+-translocating ferredoxin:NAD+ oxidoreductase RnfG subunit/ferredoxin